MNKFFILLLLTFYSYASAQIKPCYTDEYVHYLNQQHPGFKQAMQDQFNQAKAHANSKAVHRSTQATAPDTIYRIPVVFHVVYKTAQENVHDSLLYSQIRVLNEDYRRLNSDTSNTRAIFKNRAADIGVEFYLATIDPNGNLTTGITRTATTASFGGGFIPNPNDLDKVKSSAQGGKDAWDTDKYLNIWVCNTGGSILGLAYPPTAAPNWPSGSTASQDKWGVVLSYEVVGYQNPRAVGQLSIANRGRTAVHEVGHYLGLRHIWGDAGFFGSVDCDLTKDDGFDDTPHMGSNSQQTGCNFTKNTCTNGETPDEPDMVENYMDYSTESCQNMFTQQQANLMRSMIVIGRPHLAHIIQEDTFQVQNGQYVVVNGDTIQINLNNPLVLNEGDSIIFLNENNGYYYPVQGNTIEITAQNNSIYVSNDGKVVSYKPTNIYSTNQNTSLIYIHPNPTKATIYIENKSKYTIQHIEIIDIRGRKVIHSEFKEKIALKNIDNGIYFVKLYSNNQLIGVKKIIKH